jgi:hypothetical protein
MWEPSRDEQALIDEFLRGYYGPAAEPLQQYLDLINDAGERSGQHIRCFMADTAGWLRLEDLNRATELFAEAERRVEGDEVLAARVRRARLPLDHVWLKRYHALKRAARATGAPFLGPTDPKALCEDFVQTALSFDVRNYGEGRAFQDYVPGLRARFRDPGPPPKMCEGLPEEDWIDIQDNEFTLHGYGNWVTTVDDEQASDGRASRMPATHNQWATQYPVSADLTGLGKCRCYIVARCEAKAAEGDAFTYGLYDNQTHQGLARGTATLQDAADGQYQVYELGEYELRPGMYFWVAPTGNPEQVEAVLVDRMFCVRVK